MEHLQPHPPPSALPLPPPPEEPDLEAQLKEMVAKLQEVEDANSELEIEKGDLQKMLIQQEDKYRNDMQLITEVCKLIIPKYA